MEFIEQFTEVRRVFQYDYIYIDLALLLVWLGILIYNKKYKALLFGVIIASIIYLIDGVIWWNTGVREYWIGGQQITNQTLRKFGADFMMTISYALYTFPWLWIMFENIRKKKSWEAVKYTGIFFGFWILVPLLSVFMAIDNTLVETVRHMSMQYSFWIINVLIGYGILIWVYRDNMKLVAKVFGVGALGSLIMEVPLYIFGIRPISFGFLIFEAVFLLNQGVPYLFLIWDKLLPRLKTNSEFSRTRE